MPWRTVMGNITLPLELQGVDPEGAPARAEAVVRREEDARVVAGAVADPPDEAVEELEVVGAPVADASITWISGPVLRARTEGMFVLREAVQVGKKGLLGEVIRINQDEITVQVYEDTAGLRPGSPVKGTGSPVPAC